ncbi:MAG: gamma-glutamyl-gamma-aminobutyrate hydrolase family protein [Deltaproteobacteria bacterium]|nr:gamma-glutamyl-gamma-aminobutyrate hydrolase family protein [Deltaproteobacteria bacterium]
MREVLIFKHVSFEGPGTLTEPLKALGIKYREVNLYEGGAPINLEGCGGLIIMGGPMNVYEETEYPFLKDEDRLIKEALAKKLPMIGVCLGAQLMAKAAGAEVTKGQKKEIGWYPLNLTDEAKIDPAFKGLPKEIEVFQWHGDTFDIPQGAVRLASSELFQNQAFRIGNNAYAFQFHIEVTEGIIRDWIEINTKELEGVKDYIDSKKALAESKEKAAELKKLADEIYKGLFKWY